MFGFCTQPASTAVWHSLSDQHCKCKRWGCDEGVKMCYKTVLGSVHREILKKFEHNYFKSPIYIIMRN